MIIPVLWKGRKGATEVQVYLAVTPEEIREAAPYGQALAHVAYRIGPGSTLLRQSLPLQTRGGLLSVSDRNAPPIGDPDALCAAVLRECGRRGYTGAVLDFEEPPCQDRQVFAQRLAQALSQSRRPLFLPDGYVEKGGISLLCTAVSGGSFSQYLRDAAQKSGGSAALALDVERLRMDFRLPAPSGEGKPLDEKGLRELMQREAPSVFFSQELCARYFTYIRNGETHFVLFDDAETLRQKLRIGAGMGFSAAFFMWPEVRDIAAALWPRSL